MSRFPEGCAIIFGGSGGLGSNIAKEFARAGTDVAIVYRSKQDVAEKLAEEVRALGAKASIHGCDVTDQPAVKAAFDAAVAAHGRVHTVMWAAGPLVDQRYISQLNLEQWRHAVDVEVHGFFIAVTTAIPHLRAMGGGSFVTLGSAGHDYWPVRDGLSVAPKAANESLIKGIAREEGRFNIRANSILVGVIDAGQHRVLLEQGQHGEEWLAETFRRVPLKRLGQPEEVSKAAVFFASSDASYITGQVLSVSGGYGV